MDTKDATTDNKKENIAIPIGLVLTIKHLKTKNIVNPTVPKVTSSRFVHACSFSCLLELQEATEKCSTMCGLLVQF